MLLVNLIYYRKQVLQDRDGAGQRKRKDVERRDDGM